MGLGSEKYGAYPTKSSESPPSTGNQYEHIHPHPKRHCDNPPSESKRFKCELYNYLKTSPIKLLKDYGKMWFWFKRLYDFTNSGGKQPQLVLVHHLRFFGTKRSLEHQDGAKDKGITQIRLFIQEILRVLTNMLLKSSFNSSHGLNILIHIHEDPH